jgi:hypothetical protein
VAAITKDMCLKAQKEFPELEITHDVVEPENTNKTTAELIAESKDDIEQFLKYLLTDELINSLDLNNLARYSQLLAHEIIYDVMRSFEFIQSDFGNSLIIKNTRIQNTQNNVWFTTDSSMPENVQRANACNNLTSTFFNFIEVQKNIFKPLT